jgi:hypothetical protein
MGRMGKIYLAAAKMSPGCTEKRGRLGFAEVLVNDLHLKGRELFLTFGVPGGDEVGHEIGIGVEFAGEETSRDLFVIAREIEPSQVLFECVT